MNWLLKLLLDALPEFVGSVLAAAFIAIIVWLSRKQIPTAVWIVLLFVAAISSCVIGVAIREWIRDETPSPPLANMHRHIDFEESKGDWGLFICELDDEEECVWVPDPERLSWDEKAYTGEHSLEVSVELVPGKRRIYSVQHCWGAATETDVVSAKVYVPADKDNPDALEVTYLCVSLFALPLDYPPDLDWPYSAFWVSKPGWQQVLLDLRYTPDGNGNQLVNPTVKCFHIDFLVPRSSSQHSETITLWIDDIAFLK